MTSRRSALSIRLSPIPRWYALHEGSVCRASSAMARVLAEWAVSRQDRSEIKIVACALVVLASSCTASPPPSPPIAQAAPQPTAPSAAAPPAPAAPSPASPPAGDDSARDELVGKPAPDFTAKAQDGTTVHLAALRGKRVVIYFYPKDETPG